MFIRDNNKSPRYISLETKSEFDSGSPEVKDLSINPLCYSLQHYLFKLVSLHYYYWTKKMNLGLRMVPGIFKTVTNFIWICTEIQEQREAKYIDKGWWQLASLMIWLSKHLEEFYKTKKAYKVNMENLCLWHKG